MLQTMLQTAFVIQCLLLLSAVVFTQSTTADWLDRPLTNWNRPGGSVPRPTSAGETAAQLGIRCDLPVRRGSTAERALVDAGWIPFLHVDREIVRADVEIVAGMAAIDSACRPADFNVFVFVSGRLAGTLSPQLMKSDSDGVVGAVRLSADDTISADFARYRDRDPSCCPSGRVNVRYRIDRSGASAVVVPVSVHAIR